MALRLATFVNSIACTFSVKVVEPVPEPQNPANILQKPSSAIPLLTIPGVGGFKLIITDVVWYVPTWEILHHFKLVTSDTSIKLKGRGKEGGGVQAQAFHQSKEVRTNILGCFYICLSSLYFYSDVILSSAQV